jgi:hypothetical protein
MKNMTDEQKTSFLLKIPNINEYKLLSSNNKKLILKGGNDMKEYNNIYNKKSENFYYKYNFKFKYKADNDILKENYNNYLKDPKIKKNYYH